MYVTIPSDIHEPNAGCTMKYSAKPHALSNFKAGDYVYFEGDPVEHLYEVKSGVLRLTRLLKDGRRQVIAFGFPGDIVGFPCNGLQHTDCDVLADARLRPYRRSLLESCEDDPDLHKELLQAALSEISAMHDHMMMLGRKSASEKIASFLAVLADRIGKPCHAATSIRLPMSRADIADFLGLTTETVSRTLTQLRRTHVIAIENIHTLQVLQSDDLIEISQGRRL